MLYEHMKRLITASTSHAVQGPDHALPVVAAVTGLIFMLTWLAYPDSSISRYLAALVPAVMTLNFVAVGLGLMEDEHIVAGATVRMVVL